MGHGVGPRVSAIIPVYNRRHTIGRAIQSVLEQTFQDFEIIVIDDGSTDGTGAMVEGPRDARIRYVRHERNRGAAAARNTGILAARGGYLAFLDSDDEWLPHKLAEQIALLEATSADCQLSCSGFFLATNDCDREYLHPAGSGWVRRLHWICDLSPGTTLVVRRECVEDVGLQDEEFPRYEDWDWLLRLSKRYNLGVVRKPLARVHRGPVPSADVVETSTRLFLSKHEEDLQAIGWYYHRQVVSKHWLELAYWYYCEGRFLPGTRYLSRAVLKDPLGTSLMSLGLWMLKRKLPLIAFRHRSLDRPEGVRTSLSG